MKPKNSVFLLCLFGMIGIGASAYDFEVDGIYYNITSTEDFTCSVTSGRNSDMVTIPSSVSYNGKKYSVTRIDDYAFNSWKNLSSVTIPESVTSIGDYVFFGCSSLPVIDGIRYADTYAVEAIDKGQASYSIKEGTKWIGRTAFYTCRNLTSITIPASVTTIGAYAFNNCSSLTSVTIPESVGIIGSWAFDGCSSLTSVAIPASVRSINNNVFSGCSSLTSVTFPESVTSIGNSAFSGCSSLTSVTIPASVTYIDNYAFAYCSSLTSVTIPESVTSIGSNTFSGCSSLTSVTIPESVTSIGDFAFSGCSSLTSVTIPASVTSIGSSTFSGCNKVETLYWNSSLAPRCVTNNCRETLKKVVLGSDITTLWNDAFLNLFALIEVEIPSSVTSIGERAFSGCTGLISTNIPVSATSIGANAYKGCTGLVKVYFDSPSLAAKDYTSSSIIKELFSDSHVKTFILGSKVKAIGNFAFYGSSDLTSITIPKSVESIGSNAFQGCSKLKTVSLPDDLKSIGDYAFNGCTAFSTITIPRGVTKIGNSGFQDCTGMASVELSEGLESIGTSAFAGCASLATLTIPSAVTTIGSNALDGCTGLKSLIIDGSISSMGTNVFNACNPTYVEINGNITGTVSTFQNKASVREIVVGKNVKTLYNLFSGCTGLTKLTLGENLQYIRNDAFKGCTGLKVIISKNTVPPYCYPDVFFGIQTENCKLAVSSASVVAYQSEEPWNGFGTLTAFDVNTESIEITDGMEYAQSYDIAADKITYTRAFSNASWQSLYVPFEIPLTVELLEEFDFAYINGAKLYDYDDDGTPDDAKVEVFKMKSGTLLANMPYLIRAKATGTKTITVNEATLYATQENSIDCSTTALKFTFTGGYSTLGYNDIGDCYLLGGGTWNPVREGGTMKPMRFYLKIESRDFKPFKAPVIRMTVYGEDGEVTEVDAPFILDDSQSGSEDSPYYNLQGRPVEKPERGIYIVGGKKVFVQ